MSKLINTCILQGYVANEPEFKETPTGKKLCSFKIGVPKYTKEGEDSKSDFWNITAWTKTAEAMEAAPPCVGDQVIVQGECSMNVFVKDEIERTIPQLSTFMLPQITKRKVSSDNNDNVTIVSNKPDPSAEAEDVAYDPFAE